MECPTISGLRLDSEDLEAIEAIQKSQRNGNMLEIMLPAGVMTAIFLGNNSAQAAYNIHSTDWVQFAEAMTRISPMVKNRIVTISRMQRLRAGLSYEQTQFWRAVEAGCQP
ncbi:hypothetical protein [Marinobacter sp. X15-166B]|uniref:hypothetical protein n=1 Tax=Marinobacter sp. X15-166B TaxID=1897620 RepID=UPI00085C48B9|nr:hypothetical protein [Marinobacter sp. X15-166B]OEY65480.1 hypothetical protein BG841_02745 [Marinobacter sp. X15-166B]